MLPAAYARRIPEDTLLYQTVQRYFETFAQLFEERSGGILPKYIRREFEDYLACGIPSHGFLQITCPGCGESGILPFSCKHRGFCPSCGARKMAEEAAFLVDWVLPDSAGYRQYVLTVPMPLRFWMAKGGPLLGEVYRVFSEEVRCWIESHCENGPGQNIKVASGSIAFIQRFGDGLRYNPHIHLLVSEGGWRKSGFDPDTLDFVPSQAPGPEQVCELLERIQKRIVRHLCRLGLIKTDVSQAETSEPINSSGASDGASPESQLLSEMQGRSTQNCFALSEPPGKTVCREKHSEIGEFGKIGEKARLVTDNQRLAVLKGFSLHAGTSAPARSEDDPPETPGSGALERLLRYMARNSTPLERLKPASGGDVLIKLKRRWTDGTTHLRFSGVELVERLAALIPSPRLNLIRFGGCFAPRHRLRARVVAQAPAAKKGVEQKALEVVTNPSGMNSEIVATDISTLKKKIYRLSWSKLLARVFREDVTKCKNCGETLKITDAVLDRGAITRTLKSLGLPTEVPTFFPPSRAPPFEQRGYDQFELA